MIQEQIIDIPIEANVSLSSEEKEENKFEEIEEKVTQIPGWIKDSAGWWADGQLSDVEFANALKWLIQEEIIIIG